MRVTLDLDRYSLNKAWKKLKLCLLMFPKNPVELKRSSSGNGYHIAIYKVPIDWNESLQMRYILGDDERRVRFDSIRHEKGIVSQILFTEKKGIGKAETIWRNF
jgi:hypothetical protein